MQHSTEAIWQQFQGDLRRFIEYRVNNPDTVDDLLQEVFLKIHRSIEKLDQHSSLRSWIYQITRNTVIDHYRKSKNGPEMTFDELEDQSETDSGDQEALSRLSKSVHGMIEQLPEKYAEALRLTELQGLTQAQLAKTLKISLSGAKSRVQRARHLLKQRLLECCHFEFDRRGTLIDYHPINCDCCAQSPNRCS